MSSPRRARRGSRSIRRAGPRSTSCSPRSMPRRATWSRRRARRSGIERSRVWGRAQGRKRCGVMRIRKSRRTVLSALTLIHYDTSIIGRWSANLQAFLGEISNMKKVLLAGCAALALGLAPAAAQQKTVKIGFISTFSGPVAAIGNDMRNSFELGLDHLGRKLGGIPVEVIYEDDQIKPEVGVQKTQKLIESDKVDFLVGYIWSNVLLASLKPATDTKTFLITTNAGPSQIAGELCSPYVFSPSWVNDQRPAAVGADLTQTFKTLLTIAPKS